LNFLSFVVVVAVRITTPVCLEDRNNAIFLSSDTDLIDRRHFMTWNFRTCVCICYITFSCKSLITTDVELRYFSQW
jgi:hypothetical protein